MKSLALRNWTMEIVQQKPVLMLRPKGVQRGSIEIDEIKSIKVVDPDTGEVEIQTALSTMNGQPVPYTTRNVEQWPPLDPNVFRMFGLPPVWLPEDHEYVSWNPEQAQLLRAHVPATLPAALKERLGEWDKSVQKKKLFAKLLPASNDSVIEWVNEHELAEDVVNITMTFGFGATVYYRAYEEIA